jgi:transcriptional regulator with XRE-family HTH domain
MQFSDTLKTNRKLNNITQENLAKKVMVSIAKIKDMEVGRTAPDLITAKRLANVLKLDERSFMELALVAQAKVARVALDDIISKPNSSLTL